jgi:thiamine pyrophosphokinase
MKIPLEIFDHNIWTLVGPMGPKLSNSELLSHPIILVDGGAHHCQKGLIWIGDSDSNQQHVEVDFFIELNPNKDISDLKAAFDLFPTRSSLEMHLWGFLGGRNDHQLINLGESHHFLNQHPQSKIFFYDEIGMLRMIFASSGALNLNHRGIFSLVSLESAEVQIIGHCDYELSAPTLLAPLSSRGLSNFAHGPIEIRSNKPLLVLFEGKLS